MEQGYWSSRLEQRIRNVLVLEKFKALDILGIKDLKVTLRVKLFRIIISTFLCLFKESNKLIFSCLGCF